jgi:chemotaxis protein histidine kinase CheA
LSSVKSELVGLGGEVSIETAPGKGTTFIFTVPLAEPS